jgi:hypothetical protein
MLELPTNRLEYVGVLQDMGDYPRRSPIGARIPADDEVAALNTLAGRWRAVVLLDDERALRNCAGLFSRLFVLDPMYDSGALLYAAWHDPLIQDAHSRRLAEHAGLLVRAGALLNAGTAVLAPDHLPGSWNPRPGWQKPRATADRRQHAGWSMRTAMVLLYWADRLDGVVCATRADVVAALDVALGARAESCALELVEPPRIEDAQAARDGSLEDLAERWAAVRTLSRRRSRTRLDDIAYALSSCAEAQQHPAEPSSWRISIGAKSVPDPALLMRRVLNGEDPVRAPVLPTKPLKRPPLSLVPAAI